MGVENPPVTTLTPAFDEPLGPDEFRLKLDFRAGVGEASRIFKFYEEWLDATQSILDEFASRVDKRLRLKIKLIRINEGSLDSKFKVDATLIADQALGVVPPEALPVIFNQVQGTIMGSLAFLTEAVGTENYHELFDKSVEDARKNLLSAESIEAVKTLTEKGVTPMEIPPTAVFKDKKEVESEIDEVPVLSESKPEIPLHNKRKLIQALGKMAEATTKNLLAGEIVKHKAADGEVTDIDRSIVGSTRLSKEPEINEEINLYQQQQVVAAKAILYGGGKWSFLWDGRIRPMTIEDGSWMAKFKGQTVLLKANQSLVVDIRETRIVKSRYGVKIRSTHKFEIVRIYE